MKFKILVLVGIVVSTQAFAQLTPLCKATFSSRAFQEAVILINNGADVNEPCSSGFKGGLPLDMAIENAAINTKAPELAALLLSKGAVVGGYRKDVFLFLDPKRQKEFDSNPIGVPFAISPAETEYTMRKWKENMVQAQEISNAEFRERARKQDAETFAALRNGVIAVAGAAVTYEIARNAGSEKVASAIRDQVSNRAGTAAPKAGNGGSTSTPSTFTTAAPSVSGLVSANTSQKQPWQQCGPEQWCEAGDGMSQFCVGPPTGKRCKSECVMRSGIIYHDTQLPKNVAYIPSNEKCEYRCDVRNSCD